MRKILTERNFDYQLFSKCYAILEVVADYFHIDKSYIYEGSRDGDLVTARHIAAFMMIEYTDASNAFVASVINRDHATVIHACKSVKNQYDTNRQYRNKVDEIKENVLSILKDKAAPCSDDLDRDIIYYENLRTA